MDKGFVKMIEMVIASLIMLASLSYFFSFYIEPSRWPSVSLQVSAKDVLFALDNSGHLRSFVSSNNLTEDQGGLEDYIRKMLPKSTMFAIEFEDMAKPDIRIGCNCTDLEKERLKKIIGITMWNYDNITYNKRKVGFTIDGETNLTVLLKNPSIDIVVLFNYVNFSEYNSSVMSLLENGRAIMMISDVSQQNADPLFEKIFNISWKPGSPEIDGNFTDADNIENVSRSISKYFVNSPSRVETTEDVGGGQRRGFFYVRETRYELRTGINSTGPYVYYNGKNYSVGDTIIVDSWPIKIIEIDANYSDLRTYVDISISSVNYRFRFQNTNGFNNIIRNGATSISTTGDFSFLQTNRYITKNGNGRAAWLKSYNPSYTDINQLSSAVLLWLSSEKYNPDEKAGKKKTLPQYYEKVSYIVSGNSGFEPYVISLFVWYLF